jgi:hypothetical protein
MEAHVQTSLVASGIQQQPDLYSELIDRMDD